SALVTGMGQADAMHQVVTALRAGRVDGVRYQKVLIGGHSAGSGIAVLEVGRYHDVDGVLLTGITHLPNVPVVLNDVPVGPQPAPLDPDLAKRSRPTDLSYLTSKPGQRDVMYFSNADVEPGVVAADEKYAKDQVSAVSLADIVSLGLLSPYSQLINVPVM